MVWLKREKSTLPILILTVNTICFVICSKTFCPTFYNDQTRKVFAIINDSISKINNGVKQKVENRNHIYHYVIRNDFLSLFQIFQWNRFQKLVLVLMISGEIEVIQNLLSPLITGVALV